MLEEPPPAFKLLSKSSPVNKYCNLLIDVILSFLTDGIESFNCSCLIVAKK